MAAQFDNPEPCKTEVEAYRECIVANCPDCPVLGDGEAGGLGENPNCDEIEAVSCENILCCEPCLNTSIAGFVCTYEESLPLLGYGDCSLECEGFVLYPETSGASHLFGVGISNMAYLLTGIAAMFL